MGMKCRRHDDDVLYWFVWISWRLFLVFYGCLVGMLQVSCSRLWNVSWALCKAARRPGDAQEMPSRHPGNSGEMPERCLRDAREMTARWRILQASRGRFPGVSLVFPGRLPGISRASPGWLPGVSRVAPGRLPGGSRASPGHLQGLSWGVLEWCRQNSSILQSSHALHKK